MEIATPDGAHLAADAIGEGSPLILIPGLASGAHAFAGLAPLLATEHRVITFDPRGIGSSGVGEASYTIDQLADDVVTILHAFDAQPAAVFGASMGGLVAQAVTLAHPDVVSALMVGATSCTAKLRVPPLPGTRDFLLGRGAKTPAEAYRLACRVLYSERFGYLHSDFIESEIQHRNAHPVSGRTFKAQEATRSQFHACDRVGDITVPTLVMHGELDVLVPEPNAGDLADGILGARYEVFPGCGHLFFHEAPERTAELMLSFLRQNSPSSPA